MNELLSLWDNLCGGQFQEWAELGLTWATQAALAAIPLAVVVTCINLFCRRWLSAGQMGLLWCLVLIRLLLPAAPASPFSLHNVLPLEKPPVIYCINEELSQPMDFAEAEPVPGLILPNPIHMSATTDKLVRLLAALERDAMAADPQEIATGHTVALLTVLAELVWLVAASGIAFWTLFVHWRFCRRVRRTQVCHDERLLRLWSTCCEKAGVRNDVPIVVFDGVDQPAVMGLLHAELLLPPQALKLSDDELQMIMLHELAHVRRRDIALNWGLVVLRAIHWWNPIYWLAAARFHSLREQACDAFVIRAVEGQATRSYGELLLNLAEHAPATRGWRVMVPASLLGFFPAFFRKRALRLRLTALSRAGVRHGRWQRGAVAALVVLAALCGLTDAQTRSDQVADVPVRDFWLPIATNSGINGNGWRTRAESETYSGPIETKAYAVDEIIGLVPHEGLDDAPTRRDFEWHVGRLFGSSSKAAEERTAANPGIDGESPPKAGYSWDGDQLMVRAPASVHDELTTLIDAWQTSGMAQISVYCQTMTSSRELATAAGIEWNSFGAESAIQKRALPSNIQAGTHVRASARVEEHVPVFVVPLNARQVTEILQLANSDARANVINGPKITLFNGEPAQFTDTAQRPFVVGVDELPGQAARPRIEIIEEGKKLTLRSVLKPDRKHVQLTGRIDLASITDVEHISSSIAGGNVSIQVPRVRKCEISIATEIEDGQSLLIGCLSSFDRKDCFYVLLTVTHIVPPAGN